MKQDHFEIDSLDYEINSQELNIKYTYECTSPNVRCG